MNVTRKKCVTIVEGGDTLAVDWIGKRWPID